MMEKTTAAFLAILGLLGCTKKQPQQPNVILIYADDLGKGMLSAYGQKQFKTPNIDRLVHQGTSFSNAYGCMLSAPARASLLTGYHDCQKDKWAISTGGQFISQNNDMAIVTTKEADLNKKDILLAENDYYLPQVFKKAGYTTAQIGKLEWGFTATRKQMRQHGWDSYFGYLDHIRCHGFYPPFLFDNGKITDIDGNTRPNCGKTHEPETPQAFEDRWNMEGKRSYSQDVFDEKIRQFLNENKSKPFFLFHPTQLPHGPVSIPQIHPSVINNGSLTSIEKEYASMVIRLDKTVGIIMQELENLGIAENTLVIFASDNGHEIYYSEKGRCEKPYRNMETGMLFDDFNDKYYSEKAGDRFNGNAGMAGLKRSNLDGGAHIPLTFYWKNHLKANVNDELVAMYELLPTFAEWLNVELRVKKSGTSFLTALLGNNTLPANKHIVYGSNIGPVIVTNEGWKLRHYAPKNVFELYNLRKDPRETKNLTDEYPDIAKKLETTLLKECSNDLTLGINGH